MLFALIFLSLFVLGWMFCAFLPWLAVSVATRGNAGLGMLPLCLFAGVVAGLAVPLLINDGWPGVWMSFVAALAVPAALMAVRRFSKEATREAKPVVQSHPRPVANAPGSEVPIERREDTRA